MAEYNGYPSWNAWNVSLWINNDYIEYRTARAIIEKYGYVRGVNLLTDIWKNKRTPDGAKYNKRSIKLAVREIL